FSSDKLQALTSDGNPAWAANSGGSALVTAVSYGAFDSSVNGVSVMFDSSGNPTWQTRSFGSVSQLAASPSGMLYVGSSNGRVVEVR
ncbi:MAG TPA: hypothetical protein VIX12_00830, partial [Candidatus Binataceae bacterium]